MYHVLHETTLFGAPNTVKFEILACLNLAN